MERDHGRLLNITAENNSGINNRSYDRLDFSGKLLIFLFGAIIFCLVFLIADIHFRPVDDLTGQMIQVLDLSNLSIIGSGKPLRHPEGVITSVNLNFSPYFSCFMINMEYLILNPPQNSKKQIVP
jgi:hypothetical protein